MGIHDCISTGIKGFDKSIDILRLGDNVVWQIDSINDYRFVVDPYIRQAITDNRKIVYVRFGNQPAIINDESSVKICQVNADSGFVSFTTEVYNLVAREGKRVFYIFDCLTDLLQSWHSDLMIGNFF